MRRDYNDKPTYSIRDMSNITNGWANACRRNYWTGMFWGVLLCAFVSVLCRVFGGL